MELTVGNTIFVTQVESHLVAGADMNGEEAVIIELPNNIKQYIKAA